MMNPMGQYPPNSGEPLNRIVIFLAIVGILGLLYLGTMLGMALADNGICMAI